MLTPGTVRARGCSRWDQQHASTEIAIPTPIVECVALAMSANIAACGYGCNDGMGWPLDHGPSSASGTTVPMRVDDPLPGVSARSC